MLSNDTLTFQGRAGNSIGAAPKEIAIPVKRAQTHCIPGGTLLTGNMTTRSRREMVVFKHPFRIKGVGRLLPAGAYEIVTDEEMIEGLSFPSFRRVATMIMAPAAAPNGSSMEMIAIGSLELSDAQRIDASTSLE